MPSVPLTFIAPDNPDLARMQVFEATSVDGPFTLIESVTEIGSYPDYISTYTTDQATSVDDWFAIRWQDSSGAYSPMSDAVQGGQTTLVGRVVKRVRERDSSLDYRVVVQEAEAAIERYYGQDPYTVDSEDVKYRILNGLSYLVMARIFSLQRSKGSADSVTIGLVSIRSGTSTATVNQKAIDELLALARSELGLDQSRILQMAEIDEESTTYILEL